MTWPLDIGREMEDQDMRDLDRYEEFMAGHDPATLLVVPLSPGVYKTECYEDELSGVHAGLAENARDDGYTVWLGLTAEPLRNDMCRVIDRYTKATESEAAA